MAGEGALLRAAREKKGWSLRDAEEATKIRMRYLEALEEENYDILPGAVYVKGFLRNYAKYLEIDPDEIIAMYQESAEQKPQERPQETTPVMVASRSRPKWLKALVIGAVVVAAIFTASYLIGSNDGDVQSPASGYLPTPVPNAPENPAPPAEPQGGDPPSDEEPNAENPSSETPVYEGLVLELRLSEDCWLSYRVDNQPVVEKTYPAGTVMTLHAQQSVTFFSIGNAGGLTIIANGRELPKLGKSGDVVRNYVVTKDNIPQ